MSDGQQGATVDTSDPGALLAQYRPFVQYDSLEPYYTDSAAVITDHPGNALKRVDGTVLAMAGAAAGTGVPPLNLAFLGPSSYPTGEQALPSDFIGETSNYVAAAQQMHALAGYANRVHGRVAGPPGDTWLQYWFFMYYDDPGFLDLGRHEGDIEMIQLHLDASGQPDVVSYAQHRSGIRASWDEVETEAVAPVVYSARGTHASMMRGGTQISDRSFIPDHNDGRGPRVQLELIELSEAQTPWAFWPGNWGGTHPKIQILGKEGIEANSPFALTKHPAWEDPDAFHQSCDEVDLPRIGAEHTSGLPVPLMPNLEVSPAPQDGAVRIKYTLPRAAGAAVPARLVIGVDSSGGKLPPTTMTIHHPGGSGEVEAAVDPGAGPVMVRATTQSSKGAVSETREEPLQGAA
jgi:hypothetical protein